MSEWEGLARLALAALLGGVIGFERETLNKGAGLRTHMLVTLGASIFMVSSIMLVMEFADEPGQVRVDPTRIASTVVMGIGFLGGGIIFKSETRVRGLTTAAGLWVAAAIGMAAGAGFYITAVGGTALTLVALVVMRRVEFQANLKKIRDRRVRDDDEE
jgi:putative Mg2+ transporter-C (MgtC) family protein